MIKDINGDMKEDIFIIKDNSNLIMFLPFMNVLVPQNLSARVE